MMTVILLITKVGILYTYGGEFGGFDIDIGADEGIFDNIMVERLWRTVKYEEVYLNDYADVIDCRRSLSDYFRFYNTERHHTSLGCTPERMYVGS